MVLRPELAWCCRYYDAHKIDFTTGFPFGHGQLFFHTHAHTVKYWTCQDGAKSGFEMCFGPSTLDAGAKTRLESRIKKFTPHCMCQN